MCAFEELWVVPVESVVGSLISGELSWMAKMEPFIQQDSLPEHVVRKWMTQTLLGFLVLGFVVLSRGAKYIGTEYRV